MLMVNDYLLKQTTLLSISGKQRRSGVLSRSSCEQENNTPFKKTKLLPESALESLFYNLTPGGNGAESEGSNLDESTCLPARNYNKSCN